MLTSAVDAQWGSGIGKVGTQWSDPWGGGCWEGVVKLHMGVEAPVYVCAAYSEQVCPGHMNILKPVFGMGGHRKVFLWRWSSVLGGSCLLTVWSCWDSGPPCYSFPRGCTHLGVLHCL